MTRLDIGRSIADSLAILRNHPVVLVPIIVAAAIGTVFYDYLRTAEFRPIFTLYYILGYLVTLFGICVVIRMVYDATRGQASLSEAIRAAARRYLFFFAASVLYGLIVGIGAIAFIIPGVFLGIKFFYFSYAVLTEDAGIIGSLKRSWWITRGNWWRTFALSLIFMLPISLLFIIAEFVPSPGVQIINFITYLGVGWYHAAFAVAFLQLTAGVSDSTESEPAEWQRHDSD